MRRFSDEEEIADVALELEKKGEEKSGLWESLVFKEPRLNLECFALSFNTQLRRLGEKNDMR